MTSNDIEIAKLVISVLGLGGTFIAAVLALQSFKRNEKWKKAEFLAKEMKEYFDDPKVQKALQMIDWGRRRIQLLESSAQNDGKVIVDRRMQISALRPHIFFHAGSYVAPKEDSAQNPSDAESEAIKVDNAEGDVMAQFTREEASIRDCYDAFLDGLERISNNVKTEVVDLASLEPYLRYWIDDIHAPAESKEDAAWSAAFVTYIVFYKFEGVIRLFHQFGRDIGPGSEAFDGFLKEMKDQAYATQLKKAAAEASADRVAYSS